MAISSDAGFEDLSSLLAGSNQVTIRCALAELEEQIRGKLRLREKADACWFHHAATTFLSQTSTKCADIQAEILLLLVHWYYKTGESDVGIHLARKAIALAREINAPGLLRRALSVEGVLLSRKLELASAIRSLAEALEISLQIGDRTAQCIALVNLAEARLNAGLLHESLTINSHVLRLAGDEPERDAIRAASHHNIAVASLTLSDLDSALMHSRAAIQIFSEPRSVVSALQRVVMHSTYARVLFRARQYQTARSELDEARKWCAELDSRPARLQLELTEVLHDAAERRHEAVIGRLDLLRAEIKPYETAFRDLLEIELFCQQQLGIENAPSIHRRRYLSYLARWQRTTAIKEIAAIQRATHFEPVGAFDPMRTAANDPGVVDVARNFDRLDELASIAELREDSSGEHPIRVARLVYLVARKLGNGEEKSKVISCAARLHDIGKLAVPDVVLLKRGRLDESDLRVIQRHTIEGCQMMSDIISSCERLAGFRRRREFEVLQIAGQIALEHHERWNGTGYPRHLQRDQIQEPPRIAAVCDVFDCLTHNRPYRSARTISDALDEIKDLAGKQFDAMVVNALVRTIEEDEWQLDRKMDVSAPLSYTSFAEADGMIQRILQSVGETHASVH